MNVEPADDRRHAVPGSAGRDWEESWYLDFAAPDVSLGGFVRLTLRPADGVAWWWTYLVGNRRPLVVVRDHEVPLPTGRSLEVRTSGLWGEVTIETPLEHWSVGLEAFGVSLDDPAEAWASERGERVAVGLDLEWEQRGEPAPWPRESYAQPCAVHGEVLVGAERIAIDANGWRSHAWGDRNWWSPGERPDPMWVSGHLADGTPVISADIELSTMPIARAPVLITAPRRDPPARVDRALSRLETSDGRVGAGWCDPGGCPP